MSQLRVSFDTLPMARWGPLFHVLCLEHPHVKLEWQPVGFPTLERSLLENADVGLFVAPPHEAGVSALTVETSRMVVVMAAGHPLASRDELTVADILDEQWPGAPNVHPAWTAFWTLDAQRGGPPTFTNDDVANVEQGLEVVASRRAITTIPGSVADGVAHPGVVSVALRDGPAVATRLVWRTGNANPVVNSLIDLAKAMTHTMEDNGSQP
jgi:DNA-binding transcriptional LysR family regulator